MLKKDFLIKFEKMTPKERSTVALMFKCDCGLNPPISWRVVELEVKANTKISRKILKQLTN